MSHGKHRKQTSTKRRNLAIAISVATAGIAAPVVLSGTASAATQDQWDAVTVPEAGGDWYINHSGDGLSVGGLQFQNPSWHDALNYLNSQGIDTSGYPQDLYQGMPNVPTRTQQIMAGEALLHLQGPGAWVNGNGNPLGASMFDGGANPFPDGTPHDLGPGTNDRDPADTPKAPADSTSAGTYTVVSGDTLYGISIAKGLGDGGCNTWKPLYDANKDVVGGNPDLIFPGQVLRIPGDPVTEPSQTPPADPPPAPAPSADYAAPVTGGVSQPFGNPDSGYGLGYHTGVDLQGNTGDPVHAAHGGTVIIGGAGAAYGNHVVIDHGDGMYTLYAHLSEIDVSSGQTVSAGDVIGLVGSSGNSSGPHLHFELRNSPDQYAEGVFSDPVAWLAEHGVNL